MKKTLKISLIALFAICSFYSCESEEELSGNNFTNQDVIDNGLNGIFKTGYSNELSFNENSLNRITETSDNNEADFIFSINNQSGQHQNGSEYIEGALQIFLPNIESVPLRFDLKYYQGGEVFVAGLPYTMILPAGDNYVEYIPVYEDVMVNNGTCSEINTFAIEIVNVYNDTNGAELDRKIFYANEGFSWSKPCVSPGFDPRDPGEGLGGR
jgi:hypothetical protein